MTGQCCTGGTASRRIARRLSTIAASILPGALLVLLPKCPLCLAAWLTLATGVGFSATGAAWLCGSLAMFSLGLVTLAAATLIRRRVFERAQAHSRQGS